LLALANFKDASNIPLISGILNDKSKDTNIRIYAALALGVIKDPAALPELKKALDDKDNNIRSSAVMALGMIKSPDSKNDLVNILNKDKNAEVKAYALLSLAQLQDASTYPTLSKISGSKDYFLQGVSTISWGITGNEKILPELRELIEKKKRPMAYNAAIVAVGLLKDKKSVPLLMKIVEKDKGDQVAWAYAVQALAMIGDNQVTTTLEKIFEEDQKKCTLTTESYNNLLVALSVLGNRKEVLSVLTTQLENKDLPNDTKLNTLHGIGYIGDKSSIEPLINAYKQEKDNWVRMYAVQSLLLLLEKETINCYCCVIANFNFNLNRLILDYIFAK
jgi:HEAT repeat protein